MQTIKILSWNVNGLGNTTHFGGHSGSEGGCLRLVPSLRLRTSGLRSPTQPPPYGRCRLRRQRLPASPDWRRPRAKRKPRLLIARVGASE
jgi:hypothetical protein